MSDDQRGYEVDATSRQVMNALDRIGEDLPLLDRLTLVVARDAVEVLSLLRQSIEAHRADTEHLRSKGYAVRLADRMLYEDAGLETP